MKVEFEEPDTTGNDTTVTISPEPTNIPDDNADGDFTDEIEIVDTEPDTGTDDLTVEVRCFIRFWMKIQNPIPEQVQRRIHMYSSAVLQKAM